MSMATQYYPKPHMRTMGDIDLLVDSGYQVELEKICMELGYHQESHRSAEYYDKHHHSIPFYHQDKKIRIMTRQQMTRYQMTVYSQ